VRRTATLAAILGALIAATAPARGEAVDCFADRVVAFDVAFIPPESGQRVAELPGIVLGPPGDSFPVTGSVSTVSLGRGGWILLEFTDNWIVDGPGPDFIVFENAFFKSFVPTDPNQAYSVFVEPASVAVSANGVDFVEFPYDPAALSLVGQESTASSALPSLHGLAGVTPTFTGDYTIADDPSVWDPSGPGGVSGAGGDAFDLASVGLASARYVLVTDLGLDTGFAGPAEGVDLDAVVALNSAPRPDGPDSDSDGLSDVQETLFHGSDPGNPDSDGDSVPDGLEAARCRDPLSSSTVPVFVPQGDLILEEPASGTGTVVRWHFHSSTSTYDVVRGALAGAGAGLPSDVICLEDNSDNLTTAEAPDVDVPPAGGAFFYLMRIQGFSGYGPGSAGGTRTFLAGDCPS